MKKLIILSLIFLSLIMIGCKTIEYVYPEYILPSEPTRTQQSIPITKIDYALIYSYYDSLVSEWEQWAIDVEEILDSE